MRRYITQPQRDDEFGGYWSYEDIREPRDLIVFESDNSPRYSGLLDATGDRLYSYEPKTIGFLPRKSS